jgi:hypothetical protein
VLTICNCSHVTYQVVINCRHNMKINEIIKLRFNGLGSIYLWLYSPLLGFGGFISFLIFYTVGRTPWTGDQPVARPLPAHRINAHNTDIHVFSGIRTHDLSVRAIEDSSCLRQRGCCDRHGLGSQNKSRHTTESILQV